MKDDVVVLHEEIRKVCRGYLPYWIALGSLMTLSEALYQIGDDARRKFMISRLKYSHLIRQMRRRREAVNSQSHANLAGLEASAVADRSERHLQISPYGPDHILLRISMYAGAGGRDGRRECPSVERPTCNCSSITKLKDIGAAR